MSASKLTTAIQELKDQIAALNVDDSAAKLKLNDLVDNLEKKLASPDDAEHHQNVLDEVRDSVETFEIEHPRLTGILNDIMMTLSNMGI